MTQSVDYLQDERERTVYVSNLHTDVTEEILYELFLQAGPLERVSIPQRDVGNRHAFVTFQHEESVPYTVALFSDIKLFGRALSVKPRSGSKQAEKMASVEKRDSLEKQKRIYGGNFSNSLEATPTPTPQYLNNPFNAESERSRSTFHLPPMPMQSPFVPRFNPIVYQQQQYLSQYQMMLGAALPRPPVPPWSSTSSTASNLNYQHHHHHYANKRW